MNVPREDLHLLSFDTLVKSPQVYHSVAGAMFSARRAQNGKNKAEAALKERLHELLRA